MPTFDFEDFDLQRSAHVSAAADLWNAACGPDLAISARAVAFNAQPVSGGRVVGRFGLVDGQPAGFVLASLVSDLPGHPAAGPAGAGHVDALAVAPSRQRRGLGSTLLDWAENWLAGHGSFRFSLGAGLRPFAPGLPAQLGTEGFFAAHGYTNGEFVWDVAADLAGYRAPTVAAPPEIAVRPARPGDRERLRKFLRHEFPGRWHFEYEEALRHDHRVADYLLLLTGRGVSGFAHLTFEDSPWPLDRVFPHRLPRPWGQLGPLGVSAGLRGQGLGAALVHGALAHLRDRGVRGCVIDWTEKLDFYARFGFVPYQKYVMLAKAKD